MHDVPLPLHLAFATVTGLAAWLFCRAVPSPRKTWIVLLGWLAIQAAVALSGFYTATTAMPPHFTLALFPPLLLIAALFATPTGRAYVDALDPAALTLLHVVRVPVELVLYALCIYRCVPEAMTFSGSNFDILAGLSAPLVWWFGYQRRVLARPWLIAWNLVCLALLMNIVVRAVLSAPFPFQRFAFDRPNIAILHFPYVWLAACVVPLVLFAHLASLRRLLRN